MFLCPCPAPDEAVGEDEEGEEEEVLLLCELLRSHVKKSRRKTMSWKQAQKKVDTLAVDTQCPSWLPVVDSQ